MKMYLLIAAAVVSQPAASWAQTSPAGAGFQQAQSLGVGAGVGVGVPIGMPASRWITGKPYSATAVTHTVQLLADGSQIERTQSQVLSRDEQGRERIEANEGKFIRIMDPVAGLAYTLDVAAKTAATIDMAPGVWKPTTKQAATNPSPFEVASAQAKHTPNLAVEDLGTQFINGVQSQGVRTTNTIPVGAIGNNRELKGVNERWVSTDLGVQVKTVNTDPRFGTTTYDLTNIIQGPPDPSLFRVPGDYAVTQPPKRIPQQN
jgi:hypothetical protein